MVDGVRFSSVSGDHYNVLYLVLNVIFQCWYLELQKQLGRFFNNLKQCNRLESNKL